MATTMLVINQVDFSPWIPPDGLNIEISYRGVHSIVTMDGTEHRTYIAEKYVLRVQLVTVTDTILRRLLAALTTPATVVFTDRTGTNRNGIFHVTGPAMTGKLMRESVTYWENLNFTLEEQ